MNASDLQAADEVRQANRRRAGARYDDECFVCARPLSPGAVERGAYIHLRTDGTLIPALDLDAADSQGLFPVGSECARRIPAGFRIAR